MVKKLKKCDKASKLDIVKAFLKSGLSDKEIKKIANKDDLIDVIILLLKEVERLEKRVDIETKKGEKPLFPFMRRPLKKTMH